jgi:hypothetical protein
MPLENKRSEKVKSANEKMSMIEKQQLENHLLDHIVIRSHIFTSELICNILFDIT